MIKKQFLRFILIGGFSTLVNYAIFYTLYQVFHLHYLTASSLGFLTGVLAGYTFNKNWTFESKTPPKHTWVKYLGLYLVSLMLGLGFLKGLVMLGIPPLIANVLMIGLTTCTNFIGTKVWVFKLG